jgi:hypothetical protein
MRHSLRLLAIFLIFALASCKPAPPSVVTVKQGPVASVLVPAGFVIQRRDEAPLHIDAKRGKLALTIMSVGSPSPIGEAFEGGRMEPSSKRVTQNGVSWRLRHRDSGFTAYSSDANVVVIGEGEYTPESVSDVLNGVSLRKGEGH